MPAPLDLVGRKFGDLTVLARDGLSLNGKKVMWLCGCVCGRQTRTSTSNLRGGHARSCGCSRLGHLSDLAERNKVHGLTKTPTYRSWQAMIGRCEYPCSASYERYGAIGVTVCPEWRNSFAQFLADMGKRPPGKTLDRIDNDRGYEPGNCRWATTQEQAANRRPKGWRNRPAPDAVRELEDV